MTRDLIEAVATGFRSAFGREPAGVWSAPGRVSYGGDHTDDQDGISLGFAIGQRTAVAVAPREDGRIVIATELDAEGAEVELAELGPDSGSDWRAYPLGMIWAMLEHGHEHGVPGDGDGPYLFTATGLEIFLGSELPIGGGLASSASVCAAIGLAVDELWGLGLDRMQIALLGRDAENRAAQVPSGEADHVTVLFAEDGRDVFYDARGQDVAIIAMQEAEGLVGLIVDTGQAHRNWAEHFIERHEATARVAAALGVQKLRELRPAELDERRGELDETDYRRARHVVSEIQRTLDVTRLLRTRGAATIGPVLQASQDSLREDFEVSTPRIDFTVELALHCGAIAARVSGTGFGGSVFVILPREAAQGFVDRLREAYREQGWEEPGITRTRSHEGARRER